MMTGEVLIGFTNPRHDRRHDIKSCRKTRKHYARNPPIVKKKAAKAALARAMDPASRSP